MKINHPIWHPYTQEKTALNPLIIKRAKGAFLYGANGEKIYDAISSWWVNIHGHNHPYIREKINNSLFEQIIIAGFIHEPAISLSKRVLKLFDNYYSKVFFTDNGSTAVESALKMALQFFKNQGIKRKKILALNNGFHGETFGARAVSNSLENIEDLCKGVFDVTFIDPPLRGLGMAPFLKMEKILNTPDDFAAFIFEPLVQGVAGMRMQDPQVLDQMIKLAKEKGIICIADEVMTGFGRTGKMFATDYLENKPDIICLAKALTGGTLPLALTLCTPLIYEPFFSDDPSKTFLYGHSYAGNALACAAAHASLDLLEDPKMPEIWNEINKSHKTFAKDLEGHPSILEIRILGTIVAIEYKSEENGYFSALGPKMKSFFKERNVLLRPLGNIIYILPPYCSTLDDLKLAYQAIFDFTQEQTK
jgi:adenosylmethionine-8-amino-7-oxononanoate aminotransferase